MDKKWTYASGRCVVFTSNIIFHTRTCPISKTDVGTYFKVWLTLRSASSDIHTCKAWLTRHIQVRNITAAIVLAIFDLSIVQVLKVLHVNTQHPLTVGHLHKHIQCFTQLLLVYVHVHNNILRIMASV